jgi:hypothetical protein
MRSGDDLTSIIKITFPNAGEARYSFYKSDYDGKEIPVTSSVAKKEFSEAMATPKWVEYLIPGFRSGGVFVPVLP